MSAHITAQRSAILADLAVAAWPKSYLGDRIVEIGPEHGLPPLGKFQLGMLVDKEGGAHVRAMADHLRVIFEEFEKTGRF